MKAEINICQSNAVFLKNELNIMDLIDSFECGERAIYLLDENGKYTWQAIVSDKTKIGCLKQGGYSLHMKKVPPIVFVKPMSNSNKELLALAEMMFLQCQEYDEFPIVNIEGCVVAVARLQRQKEELSLEWEKLREDGVVLPENIYVSSLANPSLSTFFHIFENTGRVNCLTSSNVDDVFRGKIPCLLVYDKDIYGADVNKISLRDLYDSLYAKRKIKEVVICGSGRCIGIVANNIRKYCTLLRIVKQIDMGKVNIDKENKSLLLGDGCIAACDSKSNYEKLVEILRTVNVPLLNLYEGKHLRHVEEYAQKKYFVNNGCYPVYVLSEVYGIPDLTFNLGWTLVIYDAWGNIYDCSWFYLWEDVPSFLNCFGPLGERDEEVELDVACYVCEGISTNYWHFVFQILNRIFAMEEDGFVGKYIVLDVPHIREILQMLRLPKERIVWLQRKDNIRYIIHELHYVKYIENTKMATSKGINVLYRCASALLERNGIGTDVNVSKYPKNIYIKRITKRKLLGVDKLLDEFGFYNFIPEEHTVLEEILYFYAADVVLAPHGAGTANVLYMHEGATLIETFSRDYVNPCCLSAILASEKKVKYRMIVSSGMGKTGQRDDDYTVQYEVLRLALLEACSGN